MSTVERFISGKDLLGNILRALPLFDAPARMAAWLGQSARAIEDERRAARQADCGAYVFEPPARLRDAVLQEARALERAQEPRRQALRAALARETSAVKVLGMPCAPETEAWLRETWAAQVEKPRNVPCPPPPSRRAWWKPGLAFGTSLGIALLAGLVAHRYWLDSPHPDLAVPLPEPIVVADQAPLPQAAPLRQLEKDRAARRNPMPDALMEESAESESNDSRSDAPRALHRQKSAELAFSAPVPAPAPPMPEAAPLAMASSPAYSSHTYLWPIDSEQWQQLAARWAHGEPATALSKPGNPSRQQWHLHVRVPDAPEIHALTAFLRKSLPPDAELTVQVDPEIPAGFAKLAPPHP
ncbi:MAG: hypothetical protein LBP58_00820 [Azoarcus sp.]|jgi:hypothetical protein|nr:hypothetical protein [Azoarcus sp.]